MPGAGKSTFGRKLAERLSCTYTDMDDWIVRQAGKTIPEIFNEQGEHAFRILEKDALKWICENSAGVVATGGGAPCFFDNAEMMNHSGLTIFLDTPLLTIYNRLRNREGRPLLDNSSDLYGTLKRTFGERKKWYMTAEIHIKKETTDIREEIDRYFSTQ
jgi:shikimate kinase